MSTSEAINHFPGDDAKVEEPIEQQEESAESRSASTELSEESARVSEGEQTSIVKNPS